MNILITGATGFLGSSLVQELLKDSKIKIFGLGRNKEKMNSNAVTWFAGDMSDEEFITKVFEIKYDYVIHCAALSRNFGPLDDFIKSNVISTQNLLKALEINKSTKLIYISTPSIFAKKSHQYNLIESSPVDIKYIKKSNYIYTKYLAEKLVIKNSPNPLIIRPRAILGPKDETIWPNLMKVNKKIGIPLFRNGELFLSYTEINNLCSFIAKIVLEDKFIPKIINVCDGFIVMKDAVSIFKKYASFTIKEKKLSYPIIFFISKILNCFASKNKEPLINTESLALLYFDMTFDTDNAKIMGYKPLNDFDYLVSNTLKSWNQREMKWEK